MSSRDRMKPPSTTRVTLSSTSRCTYYSALLLVVALLYGCTDDTSVTSFQQYGTESDSAYHYFNLGWQEIMDNGRWTRSEEAFRRAVEFDPDWLLGKSLVGRITRDLEEREQILADIRTNQQQAGDDEKLILDVNLFSLEATNNMARGKPSPPELTDLRQELAERNFGEFARKYPDDNYIKAEYIEFLNRRYGAETALDSLRVLATDRQRKLGFYISYEAQLELDLGNVVKATELCNELTPLMRDSSYLTQVVLQSRILAEQDSLEKARQLIDKAVSIDPNHLIAVGLRRQIRARANSVK